ncbi:MAG TPA: hypothetical protein PLL57_03140 [Flavobacteriales bacterium]|nr:hypothetical protein [Flavobacteriales bacterium]
MVIDRFTHLLDRLARPQARWVIIGLHLVLLAGLYLHQGILADKEALKYIGCAKDVLQHDLSDLTGNYLKYAAYILFLVPFTAIGQVWLAVPVQVLIGILAAAALGRFTERSTGNKGLGQLAFALFLLCPLVQTWTLALYTDHFFTCSVILFLERLDHAQRPSLPVVLLGLLALFARPVGMFFVVPSILWKLMERTPAPFKHRAVLLGSAILFLFAITVPRVEQAQLAPIAAGQVIAGVGGHPIVDLEGSTIADAQCHLLDHRGVAAWSLITGGRILSLFALTRAHFSTAHNALNMPFYALYPLALFGLWSCWLNARVRLLTLLLLLNMLLIGFTHDEWSGRFTVPLLPWIIFMAVHALKGIRTRAEGV